MNPIKAFLSSISSVNNQDAASQNEKKNRSREGRKSHERVLHLRQQHRQQR